MYPSKQLRRALLWMAVAIISPTSLLAQRLETLDPGTRVRIVVAGVADSTVVGNVASHTADTLVLMREGRPAERISIANTELVRLEVSQGRTSRGGYVALGSVVGTGLGALGGYGLASQSECSGVACGAGEAVGAIGGGLLGLLVGAAIGAEIKVAPERWEERPLRARAAAAPRRISLSVSMPLP